jgi:hypothetical protein
MSRLTLWKIKSDVRQCRPLADMVEMGEREDPVFNCPLIHQPCSDMITQWIQETLAVAVVFCLLFYPIPAYLLKRHTEFRRYLLTISTAQVLQNIKEDQRRLKKHIFRLHVFFRFVKSCSLTDAYQHFRGVWYRNLQTSDPFPVLARTSL